jgi:asparagine synthase (glutamine-hydrolysing)
MDLDAFLRCHSDVRRIQVADISSYQLSSLLRYEDKNSMAFSIEARVPLLDHHLAEAAIALAPEDKVRGGVTKWALRTIMSDKMPNTVNWRRGKIGFQAPTELWVRKNQQWMAESIRKSPLLTEIGITHIPRDADLLYKLPEIAEWERQFGVSGCAA